MTGPDPNMERLMDLLADRATVGLSAQEQVELDRLLADHPGIDADALDFAAAALAGGLVASSTRTDALPASLRTQLESAGAKAVAAQRSPAIHIRTPAVAAPRPAAAQTPTRSSAADMRMWGGWFAAAACLAIAVYIWRQPSAVIAPPGPAEIRTLVDSAPGTLSKEWSEWPAKPEAEGGKPVSIASSVVGKVVWNPGLQKGYMVFDGLPVNNCNVSQYQLWIIDKTQKNPIDGGVFDIITSAPSGEVIVPIDARLPVKELVGFGITIEPAGGVVVSDQSQRVVIAVPGS